MLAGVLAGDMFASEDRYGTWKMVLTRSRHATRPVRRQARWPRDVRGRAGSRCVAVSSLVAGIVLVGDGKPVSLGGASSRPAHALLFMVVSWLLFCLPMLAFTSLAVLFSVASRSGIMGVIGPALVALAMQLLALVGTGYWVHMLLVASAFDAWHGLFAAHPYYGPLLVASSSASLDPRVPGRPWLILGGATSPARR